MDRRIIINADDFGLCEGVNRAVAEAHTKGILTSATIMTNMPAAAEAIETARQLPGLGVGIHINLTDGQPVSKDADVRLLVNTDGQFNYSPAKLSFYSLVSPRFRNAVKVELAAQIQWAVERGLQPTHLDSHKHIHCFPVIYPLVCELAGQFKIPAVRFTFEPGNFSAMPGLPPSDDRKRASLIRIMARINRLQNPSFFKTDMLLGVAYTGRIDTDFFKAVALYNNRVPVAEIMTHPGFTDGLEKFRTRLVQQRKIEFDALCSKKSRQYLINAGIKLVHYGQL